MDDLPCGLFIIFRYSYQVEPVGEITPVAVVISSSFATKIGSNFIIGIRNTTDHPHPIEKFFISSLGQ